MAETVVYDVKGLIKDLNALEPGLKKAMVKEAKAIAPPGFIIVSMKSTR